MSLFPVGRFLQHLFMYVGIRAAFQGISWVSTVGVTRPMSRGGGPRLGMKGGSIFRMAPYTAWNLGSQFSSTPSKRPGHMLTAGPKPRAWPCRHLPVAMPKERRRLQVLLPAAQAVFCKGGQLSKGGSTPRRAVCRSHVYRWPGISGCISFDARMCGTGQSGRPHMRWLWKGR